jgi:DNA-directed RNA polymerase specialized sigma24 family protein
LEKALMRKDSPFRALLDPNIRGAAYDRILDLLEQRIASVARKRVPQDAVKDVVQDTLIRLVEKLPELTADTDVLPYTFIIMRNVIGNYYQGERIREKFLDLDSHVIPTNPLQALETRMNLDHVLEECRKVNGDFARIVEMVLEGYSKEEIMKDRNLATLEALHTRIHRGRKQLRAVLHAEDKLKAV